MSEDSDSSSEEERSLFRPFTRESLAAIEGRIAEEKAKFEELERKRAAGEVKFSPLCKLITIFHFCLYYFFTENKYKSFYIKIGSKKNVDNLHIVQCVRVLYNTRGREILVYRVYTICKIMFVAIIYIAKIRLILKV